MTLHLRFPFRAGRVVRTTPVHRDPSPAGRVPYTAHVSPFVVSTATGHYVQAFRLTGASFESADDATLNAWHERLNVLLRNIASPNVALWTHLVRRRATTYPSGTSPIRFARDLDARYRARIAGEELMLNELYVSVVYRPAAGPATGLTANLIARAQPQAMALERADALDATDKLRDTLRAALDLYEPEPLSVYAVGVQYRSQLLEFLGILLNGEWQPMALPRAPVNEVLATTRPLCGVEAIEYRTPTRTQFGAMLGIKEYATPTSVGMFNPLLSAPFPFVLTQSFTFLSKAASLGILQRQYNRLVNSGDYATSQAEELREALDALASGEFTMGDHHLSLQVLADPFEDPGDISRPWRLKVLNDRIATARSLLTDTGLTIAREDLGLEAAFWAQLPANFSMRPRKAPITSRNFAAMSAFHNYPAGRAMGNRWGEALAVFKTTAQSPFYFSFHASDERDGGSRNDTGHTFICGPTGSGKTVLIGFLIAMLTKQHVTQVVIDKDHGLEILVRALGGEYRALENGRPTGFNPLQLPSTPDNDEFLKLWLRVLARPPNGQALSVREEVDLDQALRGTLALDRPLRRLSRLVEFLDPTDPEGLFARLARWCYATSGEYAWVFDHPEDLIIPRLSEQPLLGFDTTAFLDHPLTRTPITQYLFHLMDQLVDGRRFVAWMDEFEKPLTDSAFQARADNGLKTWRKLEGVFCAATQSPSAVLLSPIARTMVEQMHNKVYFPNPDASAADYIEGFNLTEREFQLIKYQLDPGSGKFLLKQSRSSVVCQLDLRGFDAEVAVISGRRKSVDLMHTLIEEVGADSEEWLPRFCQRFEPAVRSGPTATMSETRRRQN